MLQVSPLCRQFFHCQRPDATPVVAVQSPIQEVLGDGKVILKRAGISSDNRLSALASGAKVQNHRLDLTGSLKARIRKPVTDHRSACQAGLHQPRT
jgi:hypothetical protein